MNYEHEWIPRLGLKQFEPLCLKGTLLVVSNKLRALLCYAGVSLPKRVNKFIDMAGIIIALTFALMEKEWERVLEE